MSIRLILLISFLLIVATSTSFAQTYKVSGVVMDVKREPLPLASVEIKDTRLGQTTKTDGSFSFDLERGTYDLLVSMVGFKSRVINFSVSNQDIVQDIMLELNDTAALEEFVVKVKYKDRAEEFIRKVVQNKETHQEAAGAYTCKVYVKATQRDSADAKKKKEEEDSLNTPDFSSMGLSEIVLKLDRGANGQVKEERIGVKKQGSTDYLFYQTTTDGDFNIYNNLLKAPAISSMTFLSPISYSGLVAYKYKTVKQERVGRRRIITISVKSKLLSNATVEGEVVIMDSLWVVLKAEFRLPQAHLPENDFFEVKQEYTQVDSSWLLKQQQFNYFSKTKSGRRYGETTVVYSDYELNKQFRRTYFGNELSSTAVEAYERDSAFWNRVRSLPLTEREALYTIYQDSVYKITQSDAYLDSIDRVLNKVTIGRVLVFGQIINDHRKERMWILPPLTTVIQPFTFGGTRVNVSVAYRKTYPSRKNIEFDFTTSYGFRNKDVNGRVGFKTKYNPYNFGKFNASIGRDFQFIYPGDAWINVLKRSNVYLNNSIEVGHELELLHGLHMINDFEIALRRSVSNYKINENVDDILGGILTDNRPIPFDPYNALYGQVKLFYTPKVKYIREPKEKILLYTKWPTFFVTWRKGIKGVFGSEVDFDYMEFGVLQQAKLGVLGELNYVIKTGDFFNTKDLRVVDYRFVRRGDPFFFGDPQKTFQALDSTFPLFHRYYQGNIVHNFHGALLTKIPFLKRLKLEEVAGGGFLIAPERDLRYFEVFTGLERVFKWPVNPLTKLKLGIYVVFSAANKDNSPVKLKFGITTWDRFRNKWK
jgi:hypothetical protein